MVRVVLDEKRVEIDVPGTWIVLSSAENANRFVQIRRGQQQNDVPERRKGFFDAIEQNCLFEDRMTSSEIKYAVPMFR